MQSAFAAPVQCFSTLSELASRDVSADLVVLSLIEASHDEWADALKELSEDLSTS